MPIKFIVGTLKQPCMWVIEASRIREVIIEVANDVRAGVVEQKIFGEEYAQITLTENSIINEPIIIQKEIDYKRRNQYT